MRIYGQDIEIEFGKVKCAMLIQKNGKRHMTDKMELQNYENIRTLREKETYIFLEILEADTIKQDDMKEKELRKSISGELENNLRQNYIVPNKSDKYIGRPPRKVFGTILEVDQRRIKANVLENKKINSHL